jgi:hypothetical protein
MQRFDCQDVLSLYFFLLEPNFIGARGSVSPCIIGGMVGGSRIDAVRRRCRLAQGAESRAPKPCRPQRDMGGRNVDGRGMNGRYKK